MLTFEALLVVIGTTLLCTTLVTVVGAVALSRLRRRSILTRMSALLVMSTAGVVASTIGVVREMFLDAHDLIVLCWVIGIASVVSVAATWLVLRGAVRSATGKLLDSARHLAIGRRVEPLASGWTEFDLLSTALAETGAQLRAAREEVARLEKARREFFSGVSHDLRTPLAGIRAMAEALEDGMATDPLEYASLIRSKVDTVDLMVDALFALSKLEAGTTSLRCEVVVLLDVVSDAVVDVRLAAAARGIVIEQVGVEGQQVWADPREFTRAIGNVLANAVRHAPASSEILISAETRDGELVVSVRDQGNGVAEADVERMFDVGWRADSARSSDGPGTAGAGLGLAIVRGITHAHGGRASAHREPGGFRVELILPQREPEGSPPNAVAPDDDRRLTAGAVGGRAPAPRAGIGFAEIDRGLSR